MLNKLFRPNSITATCDDAESEIRSVLRELELAYLMNDALTLEGLFAEDFIYYDYLGRALTRDECLADVARGEVTYDSWDSDEIRVRSYGETAIINSVETVKGQDCGRPVTGRFRLTLVLVKEPGNWRIAMGHETQIDEALTE